MSRQTKPATLFWQQKICKIEQRLALALEAMCWYVSVLTSKIMFKADVLPLTAWQCVWHTTFEHLVFFSGF